MNQNTHQKIPSLWLILCLSGIFIFLLIPFLRYQIQKKVFNDIWGIINRDYLYSPLMQSELTDLHNEYQSKLSLGINNDDFYRLMIEMVSELGDSHSHFVPPAGIRKKTCSYSALFGHGAYLLPIAQEQVAKVIGIWPDSPADKAGLNAGLSGYDLILKINDQSILDENNKIKCIQPSQDVKLTIQRPTKEVEEIILKTTGVNYPYPVFWLVINGANGKKVGYIRFTGFDKYTAGLFESAFREIAKIAEPVGLIVDVRANYGGEHGYLKQVLSFFVSGELGHYESHSLSFPPEPFIVTDLRDRNGSTEIPLVILVGKDTYSSGELFAGILQNSKRAYVIGENTPGLVSLLWPYTLIDSSTLSLSVMKLVPNSENSNWDKGIIPDKYIVCDWRDCLTENDPAIRTAADYLQALPNR